MDAKKEQVLNLIGTVLFNYIEKHGEKIRKEDFYINNIINNTNSEDRLSKIHDLVGDYLATLLRVPAFAELLEKIVDDTAAKNTPENDDEPPTHH